MAIILPVQPVVGSGSAAGSAVTCEVTVTVDGAAFCESPCPQPASASIIESAANATGVAGCGSSFLWLGLFDDRHAVTTLFNRRNECTE